MYRSRQERLHLKKIARLHSARSWGGRSKLGVEYKDLTQDEYEQTRHKCKCERCVDGKKHKHLRKELVDNTNEHDYFDYRDIDHIEYGEYFGSFDSWYEMLFSTSGVNLESVMYECSPVLLQEDVDLYKDEVIPLWR